MPSCAPTSEALTQPIAAREIRELRTRSNRICRATGKHTGPDRRRQIRSRACRASMGASRRSKRQVFVPRECSSPHQTARRLDSSRGSPVQQLQPSAARSVQTPGHPTAADTQSDEEPTILLDTTCGRHRLSSAASTTKLDCARAAAPPVHFIGPTRLWRPVAARATLQERFWSSKKPVLASVHEVRG